MDHFRERVAVITGGGGGIGAALADAFAARGARIVLADLDEAAMARVAERLTRSGADVLAVPTDVTQLGSVRALAEAAARRFGAVHLVCNNAGVGLTGALHRELRPHGIGVSVLCPMIVRTNINENSVRNRPAELRNPGDPVVPPAGALVGSTIAPEEVARRVMRGVERQDLYIFTHREQREILRRRAARQDAMFEPDVW